MILIEPTSDPQFWMVAKLDEQGLPTPYEFAAPVKDLVPPHSVLGTLRLLGAPTRGALLRVAVSVAAAASFALGAMSLIGAQPATQIAEEARPAPVVGMPNASAPAPALDGSRELAYEPSDLVPVESSLVSVATIGSRAGTGASALASSRADGGTSRGTSGGGSSSGGSSGGGTSGGGSSSGGTSGGGAGGGGSSDGGTGGGGPSDGGSGGGVVAPDPQPGNSASAPGHNSTPGNSGSAPGHQ